MTLRGRDAAEWPIRQNCKESLRLTPSPPPSEVAAEHFTRLEKGMIALTANGVMREEVDEGDLLLAVIAPTPAALLAWGPSSSLTMHSPMDDTTTRAGATAEEKKEGGEEAAEAAEEDAEEEKGGGTRTTGTHKG